MSAASGAVVYCYSDGKYYHKASSCSGKSMRNGTAATLAEALVLGKQLRIRGGDVRVCTHLKPECAGAPFCCHRTKEETGGNAE